MELDLEDLFISSRILFIDSSAESIRSVGEIQLIAIFHFLIIFLNKKYVSRLFFAKIIFKDVSENKKTKIA